MEYREFSTLLTGDEGFIDHAPVSNSSTNSGRSVGITVRAMRYFGWPVDDRFWETGTNCYSDICQGRLIDLKDS